MEQFKALWITKDESSGKIMPATWKSTRVDDLSAGDVLVKVTHTTVNYKDGMALSNNPAIIRRFPMIPGIDVIGEVAQSSSPKFSEGDPVILNGYGLSEVHTGGYASYARVNSNWLVRRPAEISARRAAAIGTAGYTAMLCVLALEQYGISPDKGPVAVSGASGGVGTVALSILSKLGYHTIAFTGRENETEFLKGLGANEVRNRSEIGLAGEPFQKESWAGAVDVAGSHTLANLISRANYGGAVAACGIAQGYGLEASMLPFILRSVALLGVDSVHAPMHLREQAYERLVCDLDLHKLDSLSESCQLDEVPEKAAAILQGKIRGRLVVEVD
ncbi:MDR family oxidoreductase [Flexibacterium corallicola]|uniref:MDR family oxidoreductase n=1 Tax=Flexibacterium corallicola TaxID=3037259 RepID=UPI00286F65F6|nr:MDR family oxidoreductase [Pseudovibrio sp. M1P-2-3]